MAAGSNTVSRRRKGIKLTVEASPGTKPSPTGRRFGYAAAAVVNAALLFVVNNLLEWDLLPFLTNDFDRVVPIVRVSLVATIVVNLIYLFFDPDWFKSLSQIGLLGISMAATVRLYRISPSTSRPTKSTGRP